MSCCHGKCCLKKKIAADEDEQQPAGKTSYQKDIQLEFLLNKSVLGHFMPLVLNSGYSTSYLPGSSQECVDALFQPPQYM